MSETPPPEIRDLPETHDVGAGTIEQRIAPATVAALADQGIGLAGTSLASRDFSFIRWKPDFAQVLVTLGGGKVWCENQ